MGNFLLDGPGRVDARIVQLSLIADYIVVRQTFESIHFAAIALALRQLDGMGLDHQKASRRHDNGLLCVLVHQSVSAAGDKV